VKPHHHPTVMLSEVGSSKRRSHAVEAPHTRRDYPKLQQEFSWGALGVAPASRRALVKACHSEPGVKPGEEPSVAGIEYGPIRLL